MPLSPVLNRTAALFLLLNSPFAGHAFDYENHRLINELALQSLPAAFPKFVQDTAARERIAFLAGEPDRWRNTPDNTFKHWNAPDHYIDFEDLEPLGLSADKLPPFRHVFTMQLGEARARHAATLPAIDPARNQDRTRELVGYLPWSIAEQFSQLKSAFSYLKAYEEGGTPDEIANARQNVIQYMGVLGHQVGDAAQPLHTTRHYNGWVGANPNGFTTSRGFHSWIDGGYLAKLPVDAASLRTKVRSARLIRSEDRATAEPSLFPEVLAYVREQHRLVVPLYQLDKEGKLSPDQPQGRDGRSFFEKQFLTAAQMLGDLWFTAWKEAPADTYLRSYLARRKLNGSGPS
ncbi:MAG TPA: hypothetical protein DCY13_12980 [Verrucomicrobiales bacterium]|nr:hypothetical protein [Verrucomicrobiales bacterium]